MAEFLRKTVFRIYTGAECTTPSDPPRDLRKKIQELLFTVENAYQPIAEDAEAIGMEMDLLQVGSEPVGMRCPYCQDDVMTRAIYRNTATTHIIATVLGLLFWWMCCCMLPYFAKRWKNVEHYCPNCQRYLGAYTARSIC